MTLKQIVGALGLAAALTIGAVSPQSALAQDMGMHPHGGHHGMMHHRRMMMRHDRMMMRHDRMMMRHHHMMMRHHHMMHRM